MNQEGHFNHNANASVDPLSGLDATTPETFASPQSKSAGEVLREIREQEGMSRETLAAALKVSLKKIEAMEDNRFRDLPDMVFARGLAGSMCRYLKADPERVLPLMPAEKESAAETIVRPNMQAEFNDPHDMSPRTNWLKLSWKAMLLVAVLLLAAVIVMFIPTLKGMAGKTSTEAVDAAPIQTQENLKPIAQSATAADANPAPAPATAAAPAPAPAAAAPAAEAASAPAPAATPANTPPVTASAQPETSTVAPASATAPATNATTAAAGGDTITFKANKEAWITVRDARGDDVFRQLVAEGQTASVKAPPPLRVTVGNSDAVEVTVQGQPFNVTPYSKGRVARFEVK